MSDPVDVTAAEVARKALNLIGEALDRDDTFILEHVLANPDSLEELEAIAKKPEGV